MDSVDAHCNLRENPMNGHWHCTLRNRSELPLLNVVVSQIDAWNNTVRSGWKYLAIKVLPHSILSKSISIVADNFDLSADAAHFMIVCLLTCSLMLSNSRILSFSAVGEFSGLPRSGKKSGKARVFVKVWQKSGNFVIVEYPIWYVLLH